LGKSRQALNDELAWIWRELEVVYRLVDRHLSLEIGKAELALQEKAAAAFDSEVPAKKAA
jgi:hypothetical protein